MGRVLDALSWLVTVRPLATLAVLAVITIALGAGMPQRAPQADNEIFLSDDSAVAPTPEALETLFGDSAETVSVTLIFRGDALTPEAMVEDIKGLWFGDDDALETTSQDIITLTIAEEVTNGQTRAIVTTIAAALAILTVFYWITLRQPALAFIAVGPVVLVLIWVLGTMSLLGIPYTIITSIITALSIGIGVDYTIHVIHRYREEFSRLRNPETAAIRTLTTTGSALLGSALTTALGFAVLIFSPLPSFQQFGITVAITIVYSLIVAVLVVPPAMTVWGSYQNMRLRSMVERLWEDLDVAIDDTHRRQGQGQGQG